MASALVAIPGLNAHEAKSAPRGNLSSPQRRVYLITIVAIKPP